ncbi:MAG: orotate phosphoribosyltransferase [Spirochaetota bacterium]
MDQERGRDLLRSAGALLEGHFLLTSGNHSGSYVQCALLLSRPGTALPFMEDIAARFAETPVDTVIAPAVGGIIVAYEVARLVGARALFMEREEGDMTLRRGFSLQPGERVLVVEDVITTGGSVREVRKTAERHGARVQAVACLVDRSGGAFKPGVPFHSCVQLRFPVYPPSGCPLCRENVPLVKPGSRGLAGRSAHG